MTLPETIPQGPNYELIEEDERMILNIGPQHPAMHGTLRVVVELEGEKIIRGEPDLGFLHTGFEKLGEAWTYTQWITTTDRMNYLSPLANNIAFIMAAEKLIEIEIPERAQWIRTIMAELSRIADHCVWVGTAGLDIGAFSVFLYAFQQREYIYDMVEMASGARFTASYVRLGGVRADLPDEFMPALKKYIENLPKTLDDIETLLNRNRIWLDRTQGIGVFTKEQCLAYGVTGPVARAAGVERDLRKTDPYLVYDQLDFDVPVGENGDVYDRYRVRLEEFRQSIRILQQCMEKIPKGPVRSVDDKLTLPKKAAVHGSIEGLIHHFKLIMDGHGPFPEKAEAYAANETANGELGFYIVSDGTQRPYRLRCRPPSLYHYQAFPNMAKGHTVADSVAILGSLNVIAGELDR